MGMGIHTYIFNVGHTIWLRTNCNLIFMLLFPTYMRRLLIIFITYFLEIVSINFSQLIPLT